MRRVLITGGSGFIGTNLVRHLREAGSADVLSLDVQPPRSADQRDVWAREDLSSPTRLLSVFADFRPTHLVHLAAHTDQAGRSMADYRVHTEGVRVVLDCLAAYGEIQRSIFASTRLVCDLGEAPTCEYDYFPPNYYGRTKVIGEQLVRAGAAAGERVIVRPTSIWGPWGETPYREFFLNVARGRYVHPGEERIPKHYGYVGNLVFQLDRLLDAPTEAVAGRTFYLADYTPVDVREFAGAIRRSLRLPPPRSVPVPALRLLAVAGDVLTASHLGRPPLTSARLRNLRTPMLFDLDEVRGIVGATPYTLQEGVDATLAHLREQGDLSR